MTYEALARVDCQQNQLDAFCERTFANDYIAYEQQRRNFMRDKTDSTWRRQTSGTPEDERLVLTAGE